MKYTLCCLILFSSVFAFAQDDYRTLGMQAYQKKDFATAEINLKKALEKNSKDDMASLMLGSSQIEQNELSDAIQTLNKGYDQSSKGFRNEFNFLLAKAYFLSSDKNKATDVLKRLVDNGAGYSYYRRMQADSKLGNIISASEFQPIEEGLKKNSYPCMYDSNFRKLDFFVGVWDVFVKAGSASDYTQKVAVDSVVQSEGACSLIEYFNMTPPNNYQGRSFSFYDATSKKFRHNWAGQSGDIWNYELVKREGNFAQLISVTSEKTGGTRMRRFSMTYDPQAQTIHQYIENSFDEGKTWSSDWDAMFRKRK